MQVAVELNVTKVSKVLMNSSVVSVPIVGRALHYYVKALGYRLVTISAGDL